MNLGLTRRSFIALASGLFVTAPERVYSFAGGWAVNWLDDVCFGDSILFDPYGIRCTDKRLRHHAVLTFTMLNVDGTTDDLLTEIVRSRIYGRKNTLETVAEICRTVRANA